MRKIQLSNRYNSGVYLERDGLTTYKLCGDLRYMSITGEMEHIFAVDPSGGPNISVGSTIAGMEVKSITSDGDTFLITFDVEPKVIFLDIDGVLTSDDFTQRCAQEGRARLPYGMDWLDPRCLGALRIITDTTGAVIVVSSSWRELGRDALLKVWELNGIPGDLYGTTPEWILTKREAIEQWLKDNHCDKYVIVDDTDLGLPNSCRTDPSTGLTAKDAEQIVRILNMKVTANDSVQLTESLHFKLRTGHDEEYEFVIPIDSEKWSNLKKYADNEELAMGPYLSRYVEMALMTALRDGYIFDEFLM